MDRYLMEDLASWANSPARKPLLLMGARQVGKTWLLRELGRKSFSSMVHIDFDRNPRAATIFEGDLEPTRIVRDLEAMTAQPIHRGETLIVFDEIQQCPRALTSLKYFCEDAPEFAVAAAGSLLGISLGRERGTGFPVGKVARFNLYPLSFREFLDARGRRALREAVDAGDVDLMSRLEEDLLGLLKDYLVVGGMPAVVAKFLEEGRHAEAREVQEAIVLDYEDDMAKHLDNADAARAMAVWRSIPAQLSRENKRFMYSQVGAGGRGKSYRHGIEWLVKAGIASKVERVGSLESPLSGFADETAFKLFVLDVGLLGAMAGLDPRLVIEGDEVFRRYKGALTEQYVFQQLVADMSNRLHPDPYYWSASDSKAENDFAFEMDGTVFAVEVKGGNAQSSKSLAVISKRFPWVSPVRLGLRGFRDEGRMTNLPLYAAGSRSLWRKSERAGGESEPREPSERDRRLLSLLEGNPELGYEDLASELGVSRATVAKSLQRLKDAGRIAREGGRKLGSWIVL